MKEVFILNIYQLNIYNLLSFVFKVENGSTPNDFQNKFNLTSNDFFTKNSM